MKLLLTNIKELLQVRETAPKMVSGIEMKELPTIKNAWLLLENGLIHSFGKMNDIEELSEVKTIDCTGKIVLPSWCDSHTHLVYAPEMLPTGFWLPALPDSIAVTSPTPSWG